MSEYYVATMDLGPSAKESIMSQTENQSLHEATLSMLVMSIASGAAMALGLAPNPQTQKTEVDRPLAKFNIDLLLVLEKKTQGNLSDDESKLLSSLLSDLQMKFVQMK